jgi:hypothetical protein
MAKSNAMAGKTPHPLSVTRTELEWNGKDDSAGTCRTPQEPKVDLDTMHVYDPPGDYTVVVKVIDIPGNDTTKTVKLSVK